MLSWIGIGLIVFEEYKLYTPLNIVGIAGGVCTCLLGVKFLTSKKRDVNNETRNPQEPTTPVMKEVQLGEKKWVRRNSPSNNNNHLTFYELDTARRYVMNKDCKTRLGLSLYIQTY